MWPLELQHMVSYRWSFETNPISHMVADMLRYVSNIQRSTFPLKTDWSPFLHFRDKIRGCSIFQLCAYSNPREASCTPITATISPWASLLQCSVLPTKNALQVWKKLGHNRERGHRALTSNEIFLTFWVSDLCAKFHQNRIKIATVGARTDRRTQVIL